MVLEKRKKLTQKEIKKYYPNGIIEFQALEWLNDDKILEDDDPKDFIEKRNIIINCIGVTDKGHSIVINIDDFRPFFYVKVRDNFKISDKINFISEISKKMKNLSYGLYSPECKLIKRKIFYGFRGEKQYKFIKLSFNNMMCYHVCKKKLEELNYELFEQKVSPILKFIHEQEISTISWFKLNINSDSVYQEYSSNCQLEYTISKKDFNKINRIDVAPFRQMSYDIECYSSIPGKFPCASNPEDVIFQIGSTLKTYGKENEVFEHIITIGNSKPLKNKAAKLICVKNEKEALLEWKKLIKEYDPDIIYGYNNNGFDDEYIYERSKRNNIEQQFLYISKFEDKKAELVNKSFSSSAYGTSQWKILNIPGRINFDILTYIRREYKLDSYKLDNVSSHFLKEKLKNCLVRQPNKNKLYIKKDFSKFIQFGCDIILKDDFKEFYFGNLVEKNILEDSIECTFENKLLDTTDLEDNEIIIQLKKNPVTPSMIFESYETKDPEKIREVADYCCQDTRLPLLIVDKLSIFINQLQMASVTYVPFKFLLERGQQIKVFSQLLKETKKKKFLIPNITPKNNIFEGATVLQPMIGFFDKPVLVLDFASLYPSIIRAHNLCYSSIVLDPEFLNLEGYEYYKVEWEDKDIKQKYYFVQNTETILPELLKDLIDQRKKVRNEMKDPNLDSFKKMVLNGFQLALKVSANSIYGFLAAQTLQCTPISACTTAIGRNMIKNTKQFVNENYKDFETIYGDSVTKDTLITIKDEKNQLQTLEIKNIVNNWEDYSQFKKGNKGLFLKQQNKGYLPYRIYSKNGWVKILRVIRHKTNKKIYKIYTKKGIVCVTEDHSLIDSEFNKIKPLDCKEKITTLFHKKIEL